MKTIMTVHSKSMLAFGLAALLAAPALAQDPAPADPAVKIDLPPVATLPSGQRLPGKVIWFDLLTLDPAGARPFYEGVLGWTFEDRGSYAVARDGAVPVAGMIQMPAPKAGAPAQQSRWMPLVSVADVARAAAAAQKAGGRVLEGPGSLGARGRYAAVADPRGAQFVLVTAAGGDPVDADAPPPGWIWAELWTDDPKGSAKFYKAVVGYEAWQVGAGKQATWIYASGGRPRARVARMPFDKVPAQWLPYVVVKDLKSALGRVTELNGQVLRKPGAKGPQFAVVSDPGGAVFILEQRPEQPVDEAAQAPAAAAGAATAVALVPPPPPPEVSSDPYGLDAAQQKAQEEAAAQSIPLQPGNPGAQVVVVAPAPFASVWIAPPAWGPFWGGVGWAYPPGWVGAPWWGMPPMWGPGYAPPYYPGYRPPPGAVRPGPRPAGPGYRPPAAPPRGGGASAPDRRRRRRRRRPCAPRPPPPLPVPHPPPRGARRSPLKTVVVKIGGEIAATPEMDAIARDVRDLVEDGHRVSMVHGGGPQATALQKALGIETRMVAGRRYTDPETLEVMKYAVAGKVNVDVCARLLANGVLGVGLHGASGNVIAARRRPPRVMAGAGPDPVDLGLVGDVVGFNLPLLGDLWARGYVPVLACLGCDREGQPLNINGDTVASQLAGALRADALVLVTSAPGVLRDVKDPGSRIPRITHLEFTRGVADGSISGGMIPKLEESFEVLKDGARSVVIVGRLAPGDLRRAVEEPGSVGTVLVEG